MAYSIFISAHGDRTAGTPNGTYLVPPGVNIYFYTGDEVLLKGNAGMAFEDSLTGQSLDIGSVKRSATKVYTPFETVPNYTAYGAEDDDPAFQFDTGAYFVGSEKGAPPSLRLSGDQEIQMGELIGKYRMKFQGLKDVFWLCCRGAPQNCNNRIDVDEGQWGIIESPKDTGLAPSQVKAQDSWR